MSAAANGSDHPTGIECPGADMAASSPDHAALFAAMPTPYLVLTPELVIVDANPAYLANTGRTRAELVGRPVFEAFPGNPDSTASDASGSRGSLHGPP